MSRRNLSVIIVPHDRGHSRTIKTSYCRLKILAVVTALGIIAVMAVVGHYVILLKKTREMSRLEMENRTLTEKVSLIGELSRKLNRYEVYVERINLLLGVNVNDEPYVINGSEGKGGQKERLEAGIEIVPAENDRSILVHSLAGEIPSEWPLTRRGFITRGHMESNTSHPGVDIAVPEHTPVRATASGLVSKAGWNNVYGNFVEVTHSDGYSTVYGHNSRFMVQKGQWGKSGEIIALRGSTGGGR